MPVSETNLSDLAGQNNLCKGHKTQLRLCKAGVGLVCARRNKRMAEKEFPSLTHRPELPFGWIQWKGTEVCLDVHCGCGETMHFDGDFCYHIKCGKCGQVYECDGYIKLHPLDFEPENTIVLAQESGREGK